MADEATLKSIKLQGQEHLGGPYRCGCWEGKRQWHLCSYHEGYDDACELAGRLAEALRDALGFDWTDTDEGMPLAYEARAVLAEYDAVQRKTQP